MAKYSLVTIIYNPHSTGNGEQLAKLMQKKLKRARADLSVELVEMKHAGHAETIAYEAARSTTRALVISSSGDGGYNEVVNGVMRARNEGLTVTAGLLPAGNANDHYSQFDDSDLVKSIVEMKERSIDLLHVQTVVDGKQYERYAHSYVGLGLTSKVGRELNKNESNWFTELWLAAKILFFLKPIRLFADGKLRTYDSLIFSNIDKMSKFFRLSSDASITDGKFEVTAFKRRNKLALIASILRSSTIGLKGNDRRERFEFTTTKQTLMQIDGEVIRIDKGANTVVRCDAKQLSCIY